MKTPTLNGSKIRLEPLTLAHLDALETIAYDHRIWRFMMTWIRNRDELRRWIEAALQAEAAGKVMPWVTVLQAEDRVIGGTRFSDYDGQHRTVELGNTWLTPEFHGAGLNAEAKLLQLQYGFEEMNLNRVALKTHHENFQSQAAMRKIGAVEEGTFRNHFVMPDGTARHSVWFSIIREDWPRVKSLLEERVARLSV
jgi:RimJ/RimL family protein N-acetyltransferase